MPLIDDIRVYQQFGEKYEFKVCNDEEEISPFDYFTDIEELKLYTSTATTANTTVLTVSDLKYTFTNPFSDTEFLWSKPQFVPDITIKGSANTTPIMTGTLPSCTKNFDYIAKLPDEYEGYSITGVWEGSGYTWCVANNGKIEKEFKLKDNKLHKSQYSFGTRVI